MNQDIVINKTFISVVAPCYNTRDSIKELHRRLSIILSTLTERWEIIFVDDNSPQKDYFVIKDIVKKETRVKLVKLIRNFGQQAAISAGLGIATGEWIIVMDADLQDMPEEIPKLYHKALQGYDVVNTCARQREDTITKKIYSFLFHLFFSFLTGYKANYNIRNYGIYNRRVINEFFRLEEQFRGLILLINWLGFKSTTIEIRHYRRKQGKTSYNFFRGLNFAIDSFIAFSDRPLKMTMFIGSLISLFSFTIGVIYLIRAFLGYTGIVGWTSMILSIWFLSGFTIFFIGLIGLYIGKIFNETKGRPHYIIDFTENI